MKNTEKKYRAEIIFSRVLSDERFLIMYYLKILSRFLVTLSILLYYTPPNKWSVASNIWHFPI